MFKRKKIDIDRPSHGRPSLSGEAVDRLRSLHAETVFSIWFAQGIMDIARNSDDHGNAVRRLDCDRKNETRIETLILPIDYCRFLWLFRAAGWLSAAFFCLTAGRFAPRLTMHESDVVRERHVRDIGAWFEQNPTADIVHEACEAIHVSISEQRRLAEKDYLPPDPRSQVLRRRVAALYERILWLARRL